MVPKTTDLIFFNCSKKVYYFLAKGKHKIQLLVHIYKTKIELQYKYWHESIIFARFIFGSRISFKRKLNVSKVLNYLIKNTR